MKYMGSKRAMLNNGLGELLYEKAPLYDRFVDLFAGSGFVSWYIAERFSKPVLSIDLQKYSSVLSKAILMRTKPLKNKELEKIWIEKATKHRNRSAFWEKALKIQNQQIGIQQYVLQSRKLCEEKSNNGPVWNAYGGHYFSPAQAITFDFLLKYLPENEEQRTTCLAACISAASECVASPGHTAQPFQPTDGAAKYIEDAWNRDPIEYCKKNLEILCSKFARTQGQAVTGDAISFVDQLNSRDLVFIDPPYSGVQYSRFYHVLETIACEKKHIDVFGTGRYESLDERPQSLFSNTSQSQEALNSLLQKISEKGSTVIFTFPAGEASNGLSGDYIKKTAKQYFYVEDMNTIEGQFSTLGGNNENRDARKKSRELVLLLIPLIQ